MSSLFELVQQSKWQEATSHLNSLADGDAVDQVFYQNNAGDTAIMIASCTSAPLELVQLIITKAKLDSRKRRLLAITDNTGFIALFDAAYSHSDPAVVELLIREHPLALSSTNFLVLWNLDWFRHSPAAIVSLLTDATNALATGDYAALAFLVHGSAFALRCLASPSYATRVAVRTSLLLCLKTVHPDVPVTSTEPLDLRLAHARLCKDVWSVILEFV